MSIAPVPKPVFWVGPTLEAVRRFPKDVRDAIGLALFQAQTGGKHVSARPMKGFGGAGVLEVVEDHDGNAYRAVYTVRLPHAIYALHAFQKKSKRDTRTPRREIDLIRERLKRAEEHHAEWSSIREEGGTQSEGRGPRE